jgi:ankyrin repeat protein
MIRYLLFLSLLLSPVHLMGMKETKISQQHGAELIDLVRLVTENGYPYDAVQKIGKILKDHPEVANAQDDQGNTALIIATRDISRSADKIVRLLLEAKADPDIQGKYKTTALMNASKVNNINIVKQLLKAGADTNLQNEYGSTALMLAAYFGNLAIVNELLDAKANPKLRDNEGNTVLMEAPQKMNIQTVLRLLKAGVNPNIQNKAGQTALTLSAWYDVPFIIKTLLENKADPMLQDNRGNTALMVAESVQPDNDAIIEMLQKAEMLACKTESES